MVAMRISGSTHRFSRTGIASDHRGRGQVVDHVVPAVKRDARAAGRWAGLRSAVRAVVADAEDRLTAAGASCTRRCRAPALAAKADCDPEFDRANHGMFAPDATGRSRREQLA
ncbi:MAG: hypothetical protein IT453_07755 [Planctomycetes bacterium]|nr:hypothetical protein [Planctomycetota bacterium]